MGIFGASVRGLGGDLKTAAPSPEHANKAEMARLASRPAQVIKHLKVSRSIQLVA